MAMISDYLRVHQMDGPFDLNGVEPTPIVGDGLPDQAAANFLIIVVRRNAGPDALDLLSSAWRL